MHTYACLSLKVLHSNNSPTYNTPLVWVWLQVTPEALECLLAEESGNPGMDPGTYTLACTRTHARTRTCTHAHTLSTNVYI